MLWNGLLIYEITSITCLYNWTQNKSIKLQKSLHFVVAVIPASYRVEGYYNFMSIENLSSRQLETSATPQSVYIFVYKYLLLFLFV